MFLDGSSRKKDPDKRRSSDDNKPICQPCEQAKKHMSARKFCRQCQEFLCETCSEFHKRSKALKSHILINASQDYYDPDTKLSNSPTIKCSVHTAEVVNFLCPAHNVTTCSVCAVLDHKPCKVSFIPDISRNYNNSDEYRRLQAELDTLEKEAAIFLKTSDDNIKNTEKNTHNILKELRQFREEINKNLLSKEEKLIAELKKMQNDEVQMLLKAKHKCSSIVAEISDIKKKLKHLEEETSELFISSKQMLPRIDRFRETLQLCKNREPNITFMFTKGVYML